MKRINLFICLFTCLLFTSGSLVSQTTEIRYLSGRGTDDAVDWEFFCTDGRRSGEWTTIKVPSCWELQGFGTYQYGMPFYGKANPPGIATEQGKYRYKFKLPKTWEGKIVRIVFDGVMTDCTATINGRSCVKLHQGAFYRFKSDVSDRVFFGDKENVLEVTVSKESANVSVNLAERRADYWNFGGIFRPVFVEAMPPQFIDKSPIDAKADGSFLADIYLGTALNNNASIVVEFTDINGKPIGKKQSFPIAKGAGKVLVNTKLDNIKPWTAETPELYFAQFTLMDGNKVLHTVKERFGFRTIEVRPSDGLYVNGQKVMMRGVNRHSFRPETGRALSKKDNYDDVKLIKEMNMNAVRMSHYPPNPEFLDACDELGLYVMNELAGWHGKYDSGVGMKLVREMVERDVNHPSIIWWANGNEGGHNFDLDGEFSKYDPQNRPVLHPQKNFGGFETMHYRSYGESLEYMRQPEIFMPTEFLHGLYDGGHGAGLWDYWEIMRNHPRSAGGFLWVLADEGVVRTDQNGKIDNVGNYGADGIVGPRHEREGSFYTVKQIWSPIQVSMRSGAAELTPDFDGYFIIENRYDFINTKDCHFVWTLKKFEGQQERIIKTETLKSPDIKPHESETVKINLPSNWKDADALYLTAFDNSGAELWTWNWVTPLSSKGGLKANSSSGNLSTEETSDNLTVKTGDISLIFSKQDGLLKGVTKGSKPISLSGVKFIAARRGDRSFDVFYNHDDKDARTKERIYYNVAGTEKLIDFNYEKMTDSIVVVAKYTGDLSLVRWVVSSNGNVRLDYEYIFNGVVELMGVKFDYPENLVISKCWLGAGPYRVWQNRIHGTQFGIWNVDYNDPIPGETFVYPEFKGYFADWRWLTLKTIEGEFSIGNGTKDSYLGVFTPRDGRDVLLYTLPESGIAVLKVIPAVRNKVNSTDLNGPSAQPKWVSGTHKGSVFLSF